MQSPERDEETPSVQATRRRDVTDSEDRPVELRAPHVPSIIVQLQ